MNVCKTLSLCTWPGGGGGEILQSLAFVCVSCMNILATVCLTSLRPPRIEFVLLMNYNFQGYYALYSGLSFLCFSINPRKKTPLAYVERQTSEGQVGRVKGYPI